jgi:uncharacterized membrane protein
MRFKLIYFGLYFGAAMDALSGAMRDYGIDDDFIKKTRNWVTECISTLFLLSEGAVVDKGVDALKGDK